MRRLYVRKAAYDLWRINGLLLSHCSLFFDHPLDFRFSLSSTFCSYG